MSNGYYNASGTPGTGTAVASAPVRSEYSAIEDGFDKLPTLSAGTASKAVVVNPGGTGLTTTTGTLALGGNFSIAAAFTVTGNFAVTLAAGAAVSLTLPITSGALLASGGALGTPASGDLSNCTGTASGLSVGHATTADSATTAATATTATSAATASTVTTNANLTGPITSVGNTTSVASQTGTGSTFVMDTSPTLVTPVLGVATATSLVASSTVTGLAFKVSASNVNVQTGTSYTLVNGDNGKVVTMNNSSGSTLTVPSGLDAGFGCVVQQLGVGQVTITASSTTLRNRNGLKLAGQYSVAGLFYIASDTYGVGGDTST